MASPQEMFSQIVNIIKELTLLQKVVSGTVVAAVLVALVVLSSGGNKTSYATLYSSLSEEDAAEVVTKLKELRVPYELAMNGSSVKVPAKDVLDTRLSLAGDGLPRGGGVGFEIFDRTSLGTTDFVQKLNYQRALQGELARTIRQFQLVKEARVHIATPKDSVFIEDQRPPSASVSLKLRGGGKLNKRQIQAIVNLVGSAVTGLTEENITVVDTAGRLLFRKSGDEESMLSANQFQYQLRLEKNMREKLETMFEEIVGYGKVIARVSTELEFNQVNTVEEVFDPEGQVVRSEQLLNEENLAPGQQPKGIPGVKGELATFTETGEGGGAGSNSSLRNNVTRNYEVSKKVKNVREAVGQVKKISVAVMVDGIYEKEVDKDGNSTIKYTARSAEELQRFQRMAMNAVGFDVERGDRLEVVGMSFAASMIPEGASDVMEKWQELLERLITPFISLLVALCFIFFVARPFFKLISSKQLEEQRQAMLAQAAEDAGSVPEEDDRLQPIGMSDRERIFKLAQSDPDRAADLVRRWLREEG